MRVLLTGATGFVGRHLADRLLKNGHTVTAAVRAGSDTSRIPGGCSVVTVDLSSPQDVTPHLKNADVVCHAAGAVKARSSEEFDMVNAGLTASLAGAIKAVNPGALFILISSQAAAGPGGRGPISSYGRSKLLAEQAVTGLARYIIVRSPAALGPDDKETQSFYKWARRGVTVTLGGSDVRFCIIAIQDLADFITELVDNPRAESKILQPSYPAPVSWKDIHGAMQNATGKKIVRIPVPSPVVHAAGFIGELVASFSGYLPLLDREKALDILSSEWLCKQDEVEAATGWKPRLSLEQTMAQALKKPTD